MTAQGKRERGNTWSYRNPWFKQGRDEEGSRIFSSKNAPVEYRGFQIFNRHKGCHELVKDGVCLTQRAGGGRLKELADALLGDKTEHPAWLVESALAVAIANDISLTRSRQS